MKFDLAALPEGVINGIVQVGDVYRAHGGKPTVLWVVVAISGTAVHMLWLDRDGAICSSTSYAMRAIENRTLVGRCDELDGLVLDVRIMP